jgi:predicted  nucleic acid-binding Zn-ribbon protein
MKKLKFEKLWLLSLRENKARQEKIDEAVTCVVADNDFGKSSLVKSLYASFGADPTRIPDAWKHARVISLLRFSVDQSPYFILRQDGFFALFDAEKNLLWTASSVVKELGPQIGAMLDFEIYLKQRGNKSVLPPPAFCFLPFYIDQDHGWTEAWESFSGLGMFAGYKDEIADYHTGIKPREYYKARIDRDASREKRGELTSERAALLRAKKRFSDKRKRIGIALDVETFKDRIQALLKEQNALQQHYDGIRAEVSDLQARRAGAQEELNVAKRVLAELDADVKFAASIEDKHVVCPVCSTVHENDVANRFGLANDADMCRQLLLEAKRRVENLDTDISKKVSNVPSVRSRIDIINRILQETRGQIKLADMLKDESERLVDRSFEDEEGVLNGEIGKLTTAILDAEEKMRTLLSATRKKEIIKFYSDKLRVFCADLGLSTPPTSVFEKVRPVINETGNAKPRLMLAYYYAVLHTIQKFSTSCFAPIVIDTIKQQDPDAENARKMIEFAVNKRPADSQLVLATGDLHDVETGGRIIEPATFKSLLSEDAYEDVRAFVMPFLDEALASE